VRSELGLGERCREEVTLRRDATVRKQKPEEIWAEKIRNGAEPYSP
jgi:hypothetical protein